MERDRKQLFSNGTEFMNWQGNNCERCVKAVFYNEKKNTFPNYRCSVQRDIELAAVTDGCSGKRTYEAVQASVCPYIQYERKKYVKKDKNQLNLEL